MPRRTAAAQPGQLGRERIVASAIELADRDGLPALSMRSLARELGVDPMSIYYYFRDKQALLDAVRGAVVDKIDGPEGANDGPWTDQVRSLVYAARRVMLTHPWAPALFHGHPSPTPAELSHIDRFLGILRRGGLSVELAHYGLHVLGSRLFGFTQDVFVAPGGATAAPPDEEQLRSWAQHLPHVVELAASATHDGGLGGCDDDAEFEFVLDLLIDGLARHHAAR